MFDKPRIVIAGIFLFVSSGTDFQKTLPHFQKNQLHIPHAGSILGTKLLRRFLILLGRLDMAIRLAIDITQRSEQPTRPPLQGKLRWNSSLE